MEKCLEQLSVVAGQDGGLELVAAVLQDIPRFGERLAGRFDRRVVRDRVRHLETEGIGVQIDAKAAGRTECARNPGPQPRNVDFFCRHERLLHDVWL